MAKKPAKKAEPGVEHTVYSLASLVRIEASVLGEWIARVEKDLKDLREKHGVLTEAIKRLTAKVHTLDDEAE